MSIAIKQQLKKQSGFTMIEVLITMVIMAIGLLGIAAMQVIGLKNNHSAYLRTQATTLANQYADMLRANTKNLPTTNFSSLNYTLTPYTDRLCSPSGANVNACKTPAGCSGSAMIASDINDWISCVQKLPAGVANVTLNGDIFTISISWTDDRNKESNDIAKTKTFITSFQP